ncbi:MAG: nuclear transport factor 2 family protein [Congregibacter sp.]
MATGPSEAAILDLMCAYCDTIDSGDLAGCAALFSQGAWGIVGDLAHGSAAVMAQLDNVTLYEGVPLTRHLMSNVNITVAANQDSATASSCITVMQGVSGQFPLQAIFIGSYADTFVCIDEQWMFKERAITPNLVGDMAFHRSDMA